MACKNAFQISRTSINQPTQTASATTLIDFTEQLLFGVDSRIQANDVLQNNLTEFEWATRNKVYPIFWGRNLVGENCLTKEEIEFLHDKACKIAVIYSTTNAKETEEEGNQLAMEIVTTALELEIPGNTAIFLELSETEDATTDYMRGFAKALLTMGYTPGFKANTDAKYGFDREFSRGVQTDKEVFSECLIWAVAPSLEEYDHVTTTHLIHPDNWIPYAPSGITRNDIAIWQYGKDCHPIHDDMGNETTFNVNLVRNEQVIIDKMF